jgi:hypothetical protein
VWHREETKQKEKFILQHGNHKKDLRRKGKTKMNERGADGLKDLNNKNMC